MTVRQIPEGSNINGRPILHDVRPNVVHVAFHRDGVWWTWCGLEVPGDHQCPTRDQVAQTGLGFVTNCLECQYLYRDLGDEPWKVGHYAEKAVNAGMSGGCNCCGSCTGHGCGCCSNCG